MTVNRARAGDIVGCGNTMQEALVQFLEVSSDPESGPPIVLERRGADGRWVNVSPCTNDIPELEEWARRLDSATA